MSAADQLIFPAAGERRRVLAEDVGTLRAYLKSRSRRKLTYDEIDEVVDRASSLSGSLGTPFRMVAGMMCLETADFQYGNQVDAAQRNIGGIGATNDGAAGVSNPSWTAAVDVYFAHLCAWCNEDAYRLVGVRSPREAIVRKVAAGKGYARTFRDLGGRWAVTDGIPWYEQATMPGNYGEKIENRARAIFGSPDEQGVSGMRLALAAGHRNTSGGNDFEAATTGMLTPLVADECRRRGIDVRVITPDEGRGMFPGSLSAVANVVGQWAREGWVADVFLEVHTEGVGNPLVMGVFAIYPDDPTGRTTDLDTDVRDTLGPMLARRIALRGDMSIRGNGTMSERRTGVGLEGSRLGVFAATAPSVPGLSDLTRLIIEYGAHSNVVDRLRHRNPTWQREVAVATAECLRAFLSGEPLLDVGVPDPDIIDDREPEGGGPEDNPHFFPTPGTDGRWVVGPFFDFYHAEPRAFAYWGWPLSPEFLDIDAASPYHGQHVQYFERAVFHRAPDSAEVHLGLTGYHEALARGLVSQ
jgi:hypothetical protein